MQVNEQKTKLYMQPHLPIASTEVLETNND